RPLSVDSESADVSGSIENTDRSLERFEIDYAERAISPQNAYLVRSMMMDVVRRGTGVRAMELGRNDLAGKTGTTNEQRDAWFSGYNNDLVTTVWVGFDNFDPLGRREQGGRAALPVWIDYMGTALAGIADSPPEVPEGLARARIDPESGLVVTLASVGTIMEIFQAGRLPPVQESSQGAEPDAPVQEDPYEIY
ncbi:MAG: peptidase, partial [Gammaproteobacteria bacterium]|nr:peptidase [Gammaproteobacteria bacterium]